MNTELQNRCDESLWNRVLMDDVSAFEEVVEQHKGSVSAVAYCIVGSAELGSVLGYRPNLLRPCVSVV